MYHSYFGIEEQAFSIAVNPRYLYMSAQHREALAHLLYGVNSGGFVMLTGEVGTGKTTTIRCLLEQLPKDADVAMVLNPAASARDLLCSICDELSIAYKPDETSLKVLTDKLHKHLFNNHSRGRRTIVLIDEAQLLRVSTLEQIRLLTNLESNTQKLLQIILVGQPELNELLARPALRQLSQRITARYHLRPLSAEETNAYIRHRLTVAGLPPGRIPFPPSVIKKVHAVSKGIPRVINVLCDRMLLGAYSQESTEVDSAICRKASEEVLGRPKMIDSTPSKLSPSWLYAGASAAAVLLLVGLIFLLDRDSDATGQQIQPVTSIEVAPNPPSIQTNEPSSPQDYWVRNKDTALGSLLNVIGEADQSVIYPCWSASQKGLHCEEVKVNTWTEFQEYNRPAVLTITTPSRRVAYVTLVGFNGEKVLIHADDGVQAIDIDHVGRLWTGEFTFMWRRPDIYDGRPLGMGSTGPAVEWVAQQFATLDGQEKPLARRAYNKALEARVKKFQLSKNLEDDGFVGMQTLLRLNEALGFDRSLDDLTFSPQAQISDAAVLPSTHTVQPSAGVVR